MAFATQQAATNNGDAVIRVQIAQRISRHLPGEIRHLMTTTQWEEFCNDYDEIDVNDFGFLRFLQCLLLISPLPGFFLFGLGGFLSVDESGPNVAVIGLGMLLFIGLPISLTFILARLSQKVVSALEDICGRYNNRYSHMIFSFQQDPQYYRDSDGDLRSSTTYYIRIKPCNVEEGNQLAPSAPVIATAVLDPTPLAPRGDNKIHPAEAENMVPITQTNENVQDTVFDNALTSRQRLEQLEEIRGMLSSAEYLRKRQEIIDSL